MPASTPKAVVVHSFPRSGTHITIDFIRRNLSDFHRPLALWESASKLYLGLDERFKGVEPNDIPRSFEGRNLIAKTHMLDFPASHRKAGEALLSAYSCTELYPFRDFARTLKSFAEYNRYGGSVTSFLDEPEPFFGSGLKVREAVREHAERALAHNARPLNVDTLLKTPGAAAGSLGTFLESSVADHKRRLPRRKLFHGRAAEFAERLVKGRESTEVKIRFHVEWQSTNEAADIDAQFADLYQTLASRQLDLTDD